MALPQGPLSAYLGVRNSNEEADREGIGLLAKLQQVAEARKFREMQLAQAAADREAQRELTREINASRLAQGAQLAGRDEALRRDLAGQSNETRRAIAASRPEPAPSMVVVQDPSSPTGWSHQDFRSGRKVPGAAPPAAVSKKTDKELAQEDGKKQVSNIIGNLNASYQELSRQGAIADTSKGAAHNIGAAIASSGVGQLAGRALGTQAQGVRNQINMTRPLLMNAIRQATGQSAKSLDSNIELKFYLQAATDPTIDIASNLAALDHLDKTYGLGIGINADPAAVEALKKKAPAGNPSAPATGKVLRFDAQGNPLP